MHQIVPRHVESLQEGSRKDDEVSVPPEGSALVDNRGNERVSR
jgi:hypothetical protein